MENNDVISRNVSSFIGCESEYRDSKIVIFGAPLDATTSFRPGARFASRIMRVESFGVETYSPYLDMDLNDIRVFDGGDLELPFGNVEKALNKIEEYADSVLADGKIPCMIGGEHLVTLGAVKAAAKKFHDLHILHFDAHCDLRDVFMGEKLSHATVIRRCWDILGDGKIFQFGIRSGEREEFYWSRKHVFMNKYDFYGLSGAVKKLKGKPVYFTLDLDVLDSSVFPGTGTPEAGGVTYKELLEAVKELRDLDIIGLDINELSPFYDQSGASTAAACKMLRELLLITHH